MRATPIYAAPEVLKSNEHSKASDVYSFAIVFYEVMTNEIPFNETNGRAQSINAIVDDNARPKFTKDFNLAYKSFIEKCWSDDPLERPTFDEIVDEMRMKKEFITNRMNEIDFHKYVKFIDDKIKMNEDLH